MINKLWARFTPRPTVEEIVRQTVREGLRKYDTKISANALLRRINAAQERFG